FVDETYVKVKGKWCYLYRAIDRQGNLVDSMLSATRDMAWALYKLHQEIRMPAATWQRKVQFTERSLINVNYKFG
ncbi:MAG: DDE-type integrase/transposase/recombinase, partial [Acidobacteriaceae bacterium]|nr:DDE-type integrase/transposase/recombinase [Acidobacteriaceae bacterium]